MRISSNNSHQSCSCTLEYIVNTSLGVENYTAGKAIISILHNFRIKYAPEVNYRVHAHHSTAEVKKEKRHKVPYEVLI